MKFVPTIGIAVLFFTSPQFSSAQEVPSTEAETAAHSLVAAVGQPGSFLLKGGAFTASPLIDSIGDVEVGTTHSDSVTVTNSAATTLTITAVKSSNARFSVSPTTASITAHAERKFRVTFTPTSTGAQTALIIFTHSAATSPDTVQALGTGTAPTFAVDRRDLAYGFVPIASSKTDSVTVGNGGDAPLIISSITSSNANFVVEPTSETLQPGDVGTFRITFTPQVNGLQTGNVVFVHNGLKTRDTVTVRGSGTAFSVNRSSLAFGLVPIGGTATDSVSVTNVGSAALTISSVTSTSGRFTVIPTSASIPAGAKRSFVVTFTPSDTTSTAGNLVFIHSASSSPDSVALSGTGKATQPKFSVNRRTIPFDTVVVGQARTDSVVVTNTGSGTLLISNVRSNGGAFAVSPTSDSLHPGGSATFTVTFTPQNATAQTASILFTHNAPGSPDTVHASGIGAAPGFTLNRTTASFGSVAVGATKIDSVIVTNSGTLPLVISNVVSTRAPFTVKPSNASIPRAQSQTFTITFAPADTTPQTGFILFTYNAPGSPDTVRASGVGAAPGFTFNRTVVSFGSVAVGATKIDSVIVTNSGTLPLVISNVVSTRAPFTVRPSNASIPPTQSQTFTITFAPVDTTQLTGYIIFTHSSTGSADTVTVSGVGAAPGFTLNRTVVSFGSVAVGATKLDSVLVTNNGTIPLLISNVVSTRAPFTVKPSNASIPPTQSQTFTITFAPVDSTQLTGYIVFTHSSTGSADTVTVSGVGSIPGFALNRQIDAFGYVGVGVPKLDSVTVTNTGTVPLVISNIISNSSFFTVKPTDATIQPAHLQTFSITFTPADTTPRSGLIIFTHNAPETHDTVAVNGTGTLASLSPNRSSVPFGYVTIGGQKTDSVIVTNTGSSSLEITGVSSLNTVFTVQPGAVTLDPGGSQTYHITFTPSNTTPQVGPIIFAYSAAGSPDTVTASGTGTVAVFSIDSRSVPFGEVPVGTTAHDTVTVTNSGASTLLITNVSSTNGAFSVLPTTASIPAGDHVAFSIAFAPTNTTAQNGFLVFTHIALTSPDTVRLSGAGSEAGISFNRKTIAFGFVVLGANKVDSSIVTNTGTTPLTIRSVVSDNAVFTVSPGSAVIQPGTTKAFTITCTPKDTNPQSGTIVFTHTALTVHDTIIVSGTGLAALSPPNPMSPSNGAVSQALPLVMSWSSVANATGYLLEMATDSLFTMMVLRDPALTSPGRQVNGLPYNTRFYWHVSSRNVAGAGPWSPTWTLTTLSSAFLSGSVTFSGDLSSDSYKMFGLPGIGTRNVGSILPGSQNVDWRILRETGMDTTYPAYYQDLTADSVLRTGEGYWLLSKKTLNVSRTDTLPPLAQDGTFAIGIHQGWNIICNPFTVSVLRSAVITANGLSAGTVFWEHDGTTTTSSGTTLDPFKGYYFFNDSANVTSLKFPYPFAGSVAKHADPPGYDWRVELVFDGEHSSDRGNYIGISSAATPGRNALDQHEPPLFFDNGFLYFMHPEWDARYPRFATDVRSDTGSGQAWYFEVWNPQRGTGKITFLGVDAIPDQLSVVLVNAMNSSSVDIRRSNVYSYQTLSNRMQFTLLVGTEEYVHNEVSKLTPRTFALEQNYPNPFNPKTVIRGQWTGDSDVRLVVYDVLGRQVSTLANGRYPAGRYSFSFDGANLASGVYFYRLTAGSFSAVRKMLLVR